MPHEQREPSSLTAVADPLISSLVGLLTAAGINEAEAWSIRLAAELVGLGQVRDVPAKAVLLRQGAIWDRAYLIQRGLVRLHFLQRDGHEYNKNFFAEGSLVCPIAPSMWREPSLFGISTIEAVTMWVVDAAVMRGVLAAHELWRPIQTELLARLVMGKLQREHDLLALDARQRYGEFCTRFPGLAARVPLKHLATYLGMTDVSLSRIRRVNQRKVRAD
jgi:CRP-like cAMP-binding protein